MPEEEYHSQTPSAHVKKNAQIKPDIISSLSHTHKMANVLYHEAPMLSSPWQTKKNNALL